MCRIYIWANFAKPPSILLSIRLSVGQFWCKKVIFRKINREHTILVPKEKCSAHNSAVKQMRNVATYLNFMNAHRVEEMNTLAKCIVSEAIDSSHHFELLAFVNLNLTSLPDAQKLKSMHTRAHTQTQLAASMAMGWNREWTWTHCCILEFFEFFWYVIHRCHLVIEFMEIISHYFQCRLLTPPGSHAYHTYASCIPRWRIPIFSNAIYAKPTPNGKWITSIEAIFGRVACR